MPKRKPVEDKRVPLNCLVLPETLVYLKSLSTSQGIAVDQAVDALKRAHLVLLKTGDPWKAMIPIVLDREELTGVPDSAIKWKAPLLKPSEKRK